MLLDKEARVIFWIVFKIKAKLLVLSLTIKLGIFNKVLKTL